MSDPVQRALHTIMAGTAPATAIHCTLLAASTLAQRLAHGHSAAQLLAEATQRLRSFVAARTQQQQQESHVAAGLVDSASASSSSFVASTDDAAAFSASQSLSAADLSSLRLEVEMAWQLLCGGALAEAGDGDGAAAVEVEHAAVRQFTTALIALMHPTFRAMHSTVLAHLAQAQAQTLAHTHTKQGQAILVQQIIMQLFDEYLDAHTPWIEAQQQTQHDAARSTLLPLPMLRALAPSCVLSAVSSTLALLGPEAAAQVQPLFELRVLPLLQLTAQATAAAAALGHHAHRINDEDDEASSVFTSLPALLQKEILPYFLLSSNPHAPANLRAFYSMLQAMQGPLLWACRASLTPVLLGVLVDHFESFCAALCVSAEGAEAFFNALLLFAQIGLASRETLLVKQCLALLVARAQKLYGEEDLALRKLEQQQQQQQNKARGGASKNRALAASSASSSAFSLDSPVASSLLLPRLTCFPDYPLRLWVLYDNLWALLSAAYELHLVKGGGFLNHIQQLVQAHRAFYKHGQRRTETDSGSSSGGSVAFTPDIYLELLLRFALSHQNPYVRKFVLFSLLASATFRDSVRFSVEFLFGAESSPVAAGETGPPSLMALLSSSALQPLLPSRGSLLRFWSCQFALLPAQGDARPLWVQRFLRALVNQSASAATHANLAMHLTFLATLQLQPARGGLGLGSGFGRKIAEDDEACVGLIPSALLIESILSLARLSAAAVSASGSGGGTAGSGLAASSSPMSARVREALVRVFVRYTSFDFDEAAAAAASSSVVDSPLRTLRNLAVVLTHIAPPSMRMRSHPFHQALSRRLASTVGSAAALSGVILWAVQRGFAGGAMHGATQQLEEEPMSAAQLLALLSLLPASHPTLETVSRSIWSGLLDLLAASAHAYSHSHADHASKQLLFGMEALLGLCAAVEQDRMQVEGSSKVGSFRGVIGALSASGAQPLATTNAAAASAASIMLDQMLRGFLSSASCEALCAFLRSQLLVSLYDLPASSGDGVGAEVRAACFAFVAKWIALFPDLPAVQHLAQSLVQGAVERLLLPSAASSAAASSSTAARPLDQCTAMQVLLTVITGCSSVHPSSALSSLSSLLSGSQVLALASYLSTGGSGLVSALSGHKIVFGSVAAFHVRASEERDDTFGSAAAVPPSTMMVTSEQELKALYFRRSQAARWGLLHALLSWSLRELEACAAHSPEQLLSVAAAGSPAALLFAAGPGFLREIVVGSVLDGFDGSLAEFWGHMVQVLSACVSAIKLSARAASAVLTRVDPTSLSPEAQSLLVAWIGAADPSKLVPLLSAVFDQSWRSFQDVSIKKGGGSGGSSFSSAGSSSSQASAEDWLGWSWRVHGRAGLEAASSGEPDVPRIYSSLVGLFLHPMLFSETAAAEGASSTVAPSPSQALVKTYLLQLLTLAQKKGMRSLLYALSLALVEAVSAHPDIGISYLPELSVLLTLDNKLETRSGSGSAATGGGQDQEEERAVPMEHLIRVMLLSLMEHLVTRANTASSAASAVAPSSADGAYSFCAQSLHYFVSLNFLHAEFGMDRCGGENPLDEQERAVDELADHEDAAASSSSSAAAGAGEGEPARRSKQSTQHPVTDSRVHVAIGAVWHALCILSRLRVRDEHAQLDAGGPRSLKQRRTNMQTDASSVASSAVASIKPLKKPAKGSAAAAASSSDSSMPPVTLIDARYPLLDFVQNSTLILFISPALTSRIRHLIEIFLINLFVANMTREGTSAAAEDGGARRVECALLPYLERTVFRQNIVCSFLVIAGFLCSYLVGEQFRREQHARLHAASSAAPMDPASSFHPLIHSLLHRIHIWSSSPLGQVRTLAQYFFFQLFLEVFHRELFDAANAGRSILPKGTVIRRGLTATTMAGEQDQAAAITLTTEPLPLSSVDASTRAGLSLQLFFPVWLFLHRSAEVAAVRSRQDEYFREWAPLTRSTVAGIIEYAREYDAPSAAAKEQARVSRGLEGKDDGAPADDDAEEDSESLEAVAGIASAEDPSPSSPSSSSSILASFGTHLSARDLLLHVRRITSEHLQSLSRSHREQSYFECNDRNPQSVADMHASGHGHAPVQQSIDGPDAAPQVELDASALVSAPTLNFQQKIAPLKSQFIEDAQADAPTDATGAAASSSSSAAGPAAPGSAVLPPSSHLVVLASLVSNPLNLGGLCRTAEIMSATLVLPSLSLLDNEAFTGVSSTAHKWARIEVVPRDNDAIVTYLRRMKARGYELVGLEQTVHSRPLQRARFSSRAVLVLGDEKRGIPAAILSVLTACVEIPQFGLIRSLNVHVSAGILVWEWIKQALEAGDSDRRAEADNAAAAINNDGRSMDLQLLR